VALVLAPAGDDLQLLLMQRATRSGDPWSGQVSLPGGGIDASDASLLHTALRETGEEVGLWLPTEAVLGELDELRPRTPVLPPVIVRPYVAMVDAPPTLAPNHEVAGTFWTPLAELFDPARRRETTVETRGLRMRVEGIDVAGRFVWGMTERILRGFAGVYTSL
jgi:8-oxo-dGTP pyrophosphatase MutT (NUDIX family)